MYSLLEKKCIPCEGGVRSFSMDKITEYKKQISPKWEAIEGKKIFRKFTFGSFLTAIEFVNKVAILAEQEGHHPDISIFYNTVEITLWTHSIGGLSENDFIIAAKIEQIDIPLA